MSFKCKIGLHFWKGCTCLECGKIRNESHDWSLDCCKCSKCGTTRDIQHRWNKCKCIECKIKRDEDHEWIGCTCYRCGKTRNKSHSWQKDCKKCSQCGKIRDIQHIWNSCKCINCNTTRFDQHSWINDKCSVCGEDKNLAELMNVLEYSIEPNEFLNKMTKNGYRIVDSHMGTDLKRNHVIISISFSRNKLTANNQIERLSYINGYDIIVLIEEGETKF